MFCIDIFLLFLLNCALNNQSCRCFIKRRPVHLSMLSWSSLARTLHNILSKPLAAFQHNHCRNNGQRLTSILEKKNCRAWHRTSDFLFSNLVLLSYGAQPEMVEAICNAVENIVGKGENVHQFLLFKVCFHKYSFSRS